MSDKKAKIKEVLVNHFPSCNVRETKDSRASFKYDALRFNVEHLNKLELNVLNDLITTHACDVSMKRSGTGIVVIVVP